MSTSNKLTWPTTSGWKVKRLRDREGHPKKNLTCWTTQNKTSFFLGYPILFSKNNNLRKIKYIFCSEFTDFDMQAILLRLDRSIPTKKKHEAYQIPTEIIWLRGKNPVWYSSVIPVFKKENKTLIKRTGRKWLELRSVED